MLQSPRSSTLQLRIIDESNPLNLYIISLRICRTRPFWVRGHGGPRPAPEKVQPDRQGAAEMYVQRRTLDTSRLKAERFRTECLRLCMFM